MRSLDSSPHLLVVVHQLGQDAHTLRMAFDIAEGLGYVVDVVAVLASHGLGHGLGQPGGPVGPARIAEEKRNLERSVRHFCAREGAQVEHRVWVSEQKRLDRIVRVFEPSFVVATLSEGHAEAAPGPIPVLWVPAPPPAEVAEPVTWRDWIPEGIPYLPHVV